MKHQNPTIVLTGGGSGGHITPLLSLAHELKKTSPNCQIVYIGHKGDRFDSLSASSSDFDLLGFIKAGKFRRYHGESTLSRLLDIQTMVLNARDFFRLPVSILKAVRILRRTQPDVVFSKGSFVAVPVGIAARILRIPIVTHDSDIIPGLANKIVGRWAVLHATGMPAKHYPYPKNKTVEVGIPLDSNVQPVTDSQQKKLKKSLGLPENSILLLIAGGSLGSQNINDLIVAISEALLESNLSLHIIHLTGGTNEDSIARKYKALVPSLERKRVQVLGFTNQFYKYVQAADLIISRAGNTAIAEFAVVGRACVIIPSPFLAGGHQLKNATELERRGAAVVLPNDVQADELLGVVSELLNNDHRRWELAEALKKTAQPDAAQKLAGLILEVAQKNK